MKKWLTAKHEEVSTHSRLKAAGLEATHTLPVRQVSTHSRLKAAAPIQKTPKGQTMFQHTAA